MRLGVTGHQLLPAGSEEFIRARLEGAMDGLDQLIGISSLAAGSDQLFADVVLNRGASLHVVVPCLDYESTFVSRGDLARYHTALRAATRVDVLNFSQPSEEAFFAAGKRVVDIADAMIAIWDGKPPRGFGGTADVVHYARSKAKPVQVIWPGDHVRP